MRTFSGVAVVCLLLSSCHCGGITLLLTLVASVLVVSFNMLERHCVCLSVCVCVCVCARTRVHV